MKKVVLSAVIFGAMMLVASFAGAQSTQITTAQGFSVTAPATLVAQAPKTGTTNTGLAYTMTFYTATLPNGDVYAVAVAEYNTAQLDPASLTGALNNIAATQAATIIDQMDRPVSGQPGRLAALKLTEHCRAMWLGAVRGNKLYQFMFMTDPAVTSDMNAAKLFITSATI